MKEEIRMHLADPKQLEKMYRMNKVPFKRAFSSLYPEIQGNPLADFWNERLQYESDEISRGTGREILFVFVAALVAGVIAKLPALLALDEDYFYPRNIGFIVFPVLTAYFVLKNKASISKIAFAFGATLAGLVFINNLPPAESSDTLVLSCIHLLLFLWSVLGFAFVGNTANNAQRLLFLKYNGDLVVITTLILIAGALMTGITIGLFSLLGPANAGYISLF